MAIYHLHVKNISRGGGRSALAAAAYRAGETLPNEAEERLSAFGGRRDVLLAEICLPAGAPVWMRDRATLWNAVERAEVRKDARLAKELEFAIPRELPKAEWFAAARAMAAAYAGRGFVADLAVHDDGTGHNPHAHLLLATRTVTPTGFGPKIRSADGLQFVTEARALWAQLANAALQKAGLAVTIDSRSHAERNLEQVPGQHRGPDREERRARRHRARQRREDMPTSHEKDDFPVPDPDGRPISPGELDRAETRMLDDMHGPAAPEPTLDGNPEDARAAVELQSSREMSNDDARAYRLAPEDQLDWLNTPRVEGHEAPPLRENHLDWLEQEPHAARERRPDRRGEQERDDR